MVEPNTAVSDTTQAKSDSLQVTEKARLTTGQAQNGSDGTPSEPETLTRAEHQRLTNLEMIKQGREHKKALEALTKDKDTATKLADANAKSLERLQAEREKLQELIDEDPDKANLAKKMRDLAAREQTLKDEKMAHDSEWAEHQESLKELAASKVKDMVFDIASEYDDGTSNEHVSVKLQKLVDDLGITSEEQIRKVADTFWTKKANPEETEEEALVPPVSMRGGGGKPVLRGDAALQAGLAEEREKLGL